MRNYIVLLLIIFFSSTNVKAQRLSANISDSISPDQLSMVIPDDTAAVAIIDSIPPYFPWHDNEEGWHCGWGLFLPICCSYTVTLTIVVPEAVIPDTECALGLIAAYSPTAVKNPALQKSAHAAAHFEELVTLQN